MPSLSRDRRRQLEKTIAGENGARQIAEAGAEQSLQRLAVDRHEPHTSLTPDERTLRNQLRAHGRQLGDKRDPQRGTQTITHLKQAVAYEHWHRLLFARFLAENDLLLHPKHGVALSLDEVRELAIDLKRDWIELATEYAQRMLLREIFRPDDPALRVPLPPEKRLELEGKLDSLPGEVFLADDSLGWVYQFWQTEEKKRINKAELAIGSDELGPVTQLFTEDYMVLFLLENTLGAWWTARHDAPDLLGYTWSYLRLNNDGSPAAGTFDGWPNSTKELKVLDPCMGSGHFLTFALPILARMRAVEEGLPLRDAITAVLRDNLFGLELDPRCSQIAAFNLALTAWKLAGQHFELPRLNLACSGLGINARLEDWVKLAGADMRAVETMRKLFDLFCDAPTLGSLIDLSRLETDLFAAQFEQVRPLLEDALSAQQPTEDGNELAIAAQGLIATAEILNEKFTLVVTNVPYLGRGKQNDVLKDYCERFHPEAKADLATCFIERCLEFCAPSGSIALVTPQNWLFLGTYKKLREAFLRSFQWDMIARLGAKAFQTPLWDFNIVLLTLTRREPQSVHKFTGLDVGEESSPTDKALGLRNKSVIHVHQKGQLGNPDYRVGFETLEGRTLLRDSAKTGTGMQTFDSPRFIAYFWELPKLQDGWLAGQSTVPRTTHFGGRETAVRWEDGRGQLYSLIKDLEAGGYTSGIWKAGSQFWGKRGVLVSLMGDIACTVYDGVPFNNNTGVVIPKDERNLVAIWAYCSSPEFGVEVRKVDQKLNVTNATLAKIPFDLAHWKRVAVEKYPHGLPAPHSDDLTQWLFSGNPCGATEPLQVAVARLLGYRWPRLTGSSFPYCGELQTDGLEVHEDVNGIVCLASIAGDEPAGARLRAVLQGAFGPEYNLTRLLAATKSSSVEVWLRDEFFSDHCRIFHDRPFVWHVWDGLKDGFHALVNYHKLDRSNLEKLIYSYLGDWLTRQRQDVRNGVEGADTRLAAAEHLQGELKKILQGEAPYDIFVRWKALKEQPIGWEPDLNDGVRVNIRPWIAEARLYKATKPGILRIAPNIKYTKDRGKEPVRDPRDFPWFEGSTDRINDHHLSLEKKRSARGL